ncbi:hypothetical protein Q1695_005221 [Nippostrongylus brasiliensis]|nr:hypothetical protein Q1695_005221 [Nippostrongylus brasiliensis]
MALRRPSALRGFSGGGGGGGAGGADTLPFWIVSGMGLVCFFCDCRTIGDRSVCVDVVNDARHTIDELSCLDAPRVTPHSPQQQQQHTRRDDDDDDDVMSE